MEEITVKTSASQTETIKSTVTVDTNEDLSILLIKRFNLFLDTIDPNNIYINETEHLSISIAVYGAKKKEITGD